MSKQITIGTETYNLPESGENPPWGEELSDIIEALSESVNTIQGPNDITETSISLLNTSGAKNITGLAFNPSQVRSVEISYNISRTITKTISTIPTGTGVIQLDCTTAHNLFTGDTFTISGSNSTPSIDGVYTITKIDSDSFTIDIGSTNITVAGTSGTFPVELVESGIILVNYGQQGWAFSQERVDNPSALVELSVLSTGQFQYNPTVLTGASYVGVMKFMAKALITT